MYPYRYIYICIYTYPYISTNLWFMVGWPSSYQQVQPIHTRDNNMLCDWCVIIPLPNEKHTLTFPLTSIAPENWWLEYSFPFGIPFFRCKLLVSGRVLVVGHPHKKRPREFHHPQGNKCLSPTSTLQPGWWLNPKKFLNGIPSHPFGTPWEGPGTSCFVCFFKVDPLHSLKF